MPSNVEIKARFGNLDRIRTIAEQLATEPSQTIVQEDVFFACSLGRLKLRIFPDDTGELIHYVRPDAAETRLSRYEIHRTSAPQVLRRILTSAYGQTVVVKKTRTLYLTGQTRIHLDEVMDLGTFVELEVVLTPGQSAEEGHRIAHELMEQLEIQPSDLVPCAYADLLAGSVDQGLKPGATDAETEKTVFSMEDVLVMLDGYLAIRQGSWWDGFFSDREKPCPFFVEYPDESLAEYFESGQLRAGRVLGLGCGHGRNAIFFARHGCTVDAVDLSRTALDWAQERAVQAGFDINFMCKSLFDIHPPSQLYDIIYDCGCFHHLPPHRRSSYIKLIQTLLQPNGRFGLVSFTPVGGSGLTDEDVYEQRSLGGGMGYTDGQLRDIFSPAFEILSMRKMKHMEPEDNRFGRNFLWAALMKPLRSEIRDVPGMDSNMINPEMTD